jgi:hypothetical protein
VIAATSRQMGDSDVSPRCAHRGAGSTIYDAVDTGELTEEAFLIVRGFLTADLDTAFQLAAAVLAWRAIGQIGPYCANSPPARAAFNIATFLPSRARGLHQHRGSGTADTARLPLEGLSAFGGGLED